MLWRRRVRAALLAAIVVCFVVSIPWYRTAGAMPAQWLGLPDWVAVALVCYALATVLNAVAWLLTDMEDDGADSKERRA